MVGSTREDQDSWGIEPGTAGTYVVADRVDELFEQAVRAGAIVVRGPNDTELRFSGSHRARHRREPVVLRHLRGRVTKSAAAPPAVTPAPDETSRPTRSFAPSWHPRLAPNLAVWHLAEVGSRYGERPSIGDVGE